jgi:phosphoribosylanthranilate isomerase
MKQRVRVKICGICSLEDAIAAIDAGADALGFMFYEGSSRNISLESAAKIISKLPPFVTRTGVFVNASDEVIQTAATRLPLDVVQLHGDETPEQCARCTIQVVKAFRIENESSLKRLAAYKTSAWLLDSFAKGQPGGTGVTFNWALAKLASGHGTPIMLAGGLTPENVAEAVRRTDPYAVDVSSGVESAPGKKDAAKMSAFIAAVRSACP